MKKPLYITHWCKISDQVMIFDDKKEVFEENFTNFAAFIKTLYKKEQVGYPKFYKMDDLSKLGFLTAELLLMKSDVLKKYRKDEVGVVIANSSSSLDTDYDYQELIKDKSNYFPSPAVFVYTLPNILVGEICIRHRIRGENAFFISKGFDPGQIFTYVAHLFDQEKITACLCGWVDLLKEKYNSLLFVVERMENYSMEVPDNGVCLFNTNNIYKLYEND